MPALKTLGVTPLVGLLSLGVALAIGVMSSFVPAWGASRTSILEALRFSG
jgi:ABC-type antimicrobial peptide transport system permease subunit